MKLSIKDKSVNCPNDLSAKGTVALE